MIPSKIYVASSWRNDYQPGVVRLLRSLGHEVYDFRSPPNGDKGFSWFEVDAPWQSWTPEQYRENLQCPIAKRGFSNDWQGMLWADLCVLVLPSGRSAHTEAGYMAGSKKPVIVYQPSACEPELMYRLFSRIVVSESELRNLFTCTDPVV